MPIFVFSAAKADKGRAPAATAADAREHCGAHVGCPMPPPSADARNRGKLPSPRRSAHSRRWRAGRTSGLPIAGLPTRLRRSPIFQYWPATRHKRQCATLRARKRRLHETLRGRSRIDFPIRWAAPPDRGPREARPEAGSAGG
jgi:hypothetical protein